MNPPDRPLLRAIILACLVCLCNACKEQINPHLSVEADADVLVAATLKASGQTAEASTARESNRIVLTLNNAPSASHPLEQDLALKEIELFESKNPGIRVEYSTWRFTPESFFERARNRSLTDIIEIDAPQAQPIIDLSYAADLTDNAAAAPEMRDFNPDVMEFLTRDNRVYGIPVELQTMALFYNRRIWVRAMNPKPVPDPAPRITVPEKKKGKGADSDPRDYLNDPGQGIQIAQGRRYQDSNYYPSPATDEEDQPRANRRGEEAVSDYYQIQERRTSRQRGAVQSYYDTQQYQHQPESAAPSKKKSRAASTASQEGSASAQPSSADAAVPESAEPRRKPRRKIDEDILTTDTAVARPAASPSERQPETTVVINTALPQDWDMLIRIAVKLTDHSVGIYGYAPVLFAEGGGREFTQWAVQAGLSVQSLKNGTVSLDVGTSAAAEVAQFLKEMRWRYDVTPPTDKCYYDNLLKMFADGKIAMMMLPATRESFQRLVKLGMPTNDIGVGMLPAGPQNRDHLMFGRCLIINSQLDREHRAAAFKWLMFQHDPEHLKFREQFYFREQEMTGYPMVPLFNRAKQDQVSEMLKPYRSLPCYPDYENSIAPHLRCEPPYFTDRFYEAVAQGVRPIIERQNSQPMQEIAGVCIDFENKYLRNAPTRNGIERYLKVFSRK